VLRTQRDWPQSKLAEKSGLTQGVISRAEDPEYGNLTVNTLVRIAGGFDCAFVGRFVPFSDLARWYEDLENEEALEVPSFDEEIETPKTHSELENKAVAASKVIRLARVNASGVFDDGAASTARANEVEPVKDITRMPPRSESFIDSSGVAYVT
jgi:transcriptional regulator with XRE-family HTH domain